MEQSTARTAHGWRSFVDLRPGEGVSLIASGLYFFLVLGSYYTLRPVREAVGIERGYDNLPWLMTATLGAMLLVNPLFAWLVSRVPRRVFIPATHRFFATNVVLMGGMFLLLDDHARVWLGYVFYVWLSVFNLFVISLFWAFMTDAWGREAGGRLFGAIGVGGTLGAMAGAAFTQHLARDLHTGVLMLASAVLLECGVWAMRWVARARGSIITSSARSEREPGPGMLAGLRLVVTSRYFALICLYMLVFTTTQTFVYLEQGRIVEAAYPDRAARTAAFASLDFWTNTLTLLVQLFLTGRLIRWLGIGGTLCIMPAVTLLGFVALWLVGSRGEGAGSGEVTRTVFLTLFVFQVVRRSSQYAVARPTRELLFTGVSPDARYKAKTAIDTFVYRAGDMMGAWLPGVLGLAGGALGMVAGGLCLGWMGVAGGVGAMRKRLDSGRNI
ncbi:MAG: Npt1/Npt2 family nucleotide transporter [Phycisphaerales bacterium]|nr:Npt1/Npt2 family nucleotide transporter [Phycisphaerales bacterium]